MSDKLVFVLVSVGQEFWPVLFTAMSQSRTLHQSALNGSILTPLRAAYPGFQVICYLWPWETGLTHKWPSSSRVTSQWLWSGSEYLPWSQNICISAFDQEVAVCTICWNRLGLDLPEAAVLGLRGAKWPNWGLSQQLGREKILSI